jgi:hypothetical protein
MKEIELSDKFRHCDYIVYLWMPHGDHPRPPLVLLREPQHSTAQYNTVQHSTGGTPHISPDRAGAYAITCGQLTSGCLCTRSCSRWGCK